MLRVVFVLRSTEIHPVFSSFLNVKNTGALNAGVEGEEGG